MEVNKRLTKVFTFIVLIQSLSLMQMLFYDSYNGDYSATTDISYSNLIFCYLLSLIPFTSVYLFLKKDLPNKRFSIEEISNFKVFVIVLLVIDIFLAFLFKVGRVGYSEIYEVPFYLKPFIVFINRINPYVVTGCILLASNFSKKIKYLTVILIVFLSIARASLFSFLFLALILSAFMDYKFKLKKVFFLLLMLYFFVPIIPELFNYRDSLRSGEETNLIELIDFNEIVKFVSSKLFGRISSLSAIAFNFGNIKPLYSEIHLLGSFDYILEFLKPITAGFSNNTQKDFTYFLTNFFDPFSGSDYGIMYGLPSVLLVSLLKGVHILILNFIFIIFIIYIILCQCRFLFGQYYKEFSLVILYAPISSGVASEFSSILISLIVLSIVKLVYRHFLKN